jgi:PAS domain-containing protein
MNPAAEATTGWAQEDVMGLPIVQVLPVVAEETLLPVESNVLRALEEGKAIQTPDGSLLIARDGTALPIDSNATLSGTPGEGHRHV